MAVWLHKLSRRPAGEVGTWDVLAILFAFAAVILLASAPFARTSNTGPAVAESRSTTLQAGILCAVVTPACWWQGRRRRAHPKT